MPLELDFDGPDGTPHWLTPEGGLRKSKDSALDLDWDESEHPRDEAGRFAESGSVRSFDGNEGYEWHEKGPVAEWAKALPYKESRAIDNYAGFGYGDINAQLRGKLETPVKTRYRGDIPEAEREAFDQAVRDGQAAVGKKPWEPGEIEFKGEKWVLGPGDSIWHHDEVDQERLDKIRRDIDSINGTIRERGYELPEAMEVNRAAYLPGVSYDDLKSKEGKVFVERGFTSTMVGNPNKRLDGYAAHAKFESLYKRHGGKIAEHQDEVGVAMRIKIELPEGTKVIPVEAVRRMEYDFPKKPITSMPRPADIEPEYWTERDYDATPTVRADKLNSKEGRTEAEVLLGSDARFRIVSVEKGEPYRSSDDSLKAVEIVNVTMRYEGGGSSDGRR
jgi:hypothetical protein